VPASSAKRIADSPKVFLRYSLQMVERVLATDAALALIERLLAMPSWVTAHTLRNDPRYHRLHGDPRFQRLLRQPPS